MSTLSISDVEIANRGADEFLRVYYTTYDSAQRVEGVPKFYRETSHLSYNGTAVTGPERIKVLLEQIPVSKHEVQSYDCHPIPSTSPPALLITVSGLVSHGPGTSATGGSESVAVSSTAPSSTSSSSAVAGSASSKSSRNVDAQPRVFSQSFVLMKSTEDKYYVASDHFRFVG